MLAKQFLLLSMAVTLSATGAYAQQKSEDLCSSDCLLTGGSKGDYFLHFAPPVRKLLEKAWVDAPIANSPGSPATMDWIKDHPNSYGFVQGNILAIRAQDPAVNASIRIIDGDSIGDEAVLAIMNDKIFQRSQGSWAATAKHAKQVRFVTASENSGPGATFKSLMALDPDNLGKANVVYKPDMDQAIAAVADGTADVALMVQFANPENPRFEAIHASKLHIVPVLMPAMKNLLLPNNKRAYEVCENVNVGEESPIDTACTPIQLITGSANDNKDLARVFGAVTKADFVPQESGFAKFWKSIKVTSTSVANSAFDKADALANAVAERFN